MDGRTFVKVIKEAELGKGVTTTDCDLTFTKVKAKGQKKIKFPEFCKAIDEIAKKAKCSTESLAARLAEQNPYAEMAAKAAVNQGDGPAKFFYDKSTFTGTHTKGGPTTADTATGNYGDLSALTNRDHVQNDNLHRNKGNAGATQSYNAERPKEIGTGNQGSSVPTNKTRASLDTRAAPGNNTNNNSAQGGQKPSGAAPSGGAPRGPERFFYDKGSYTGAHKAGGPSHNDPSALQLRPGHN